MVYNYSTFKKFNSFNETLTKIGTQYDVILPPLVFKIYLILFGIDLTNFEQSSKVTLDQMSFIALINSVLVLIW